MSEGLQRKRLWQPRSIMNISTWNSKGFQNEMEEQFKRLEPMNVSTAVNTETGEESVGI